MQPATFTLDLGPLGPDAVVVNGRDVTADIEAVSLLSRHGAPTEVRLGLRPGSDVARIEGEGVVHVESPDGESVADWLAGVDAGELERTALERLHLHDGSPIAVALLVLREWAADGRP